MVITRHENYFLKFIFGDKTIGLNPVSKESKLKTTKFGADIVLSNLPHKDFNGFNFMNYGEKEAFKIKGPGEYEISNVFINGFGFISKFDGEERMLTSYSMLLDGMNLTIIAPISETEKFSNEAFEEFGKTDILILPIGGGDTFNPKEAWKFAKQFAPKIIIPVMGSKDDLKEFQSESGLEIEKVDKLTLKQKDLPAEGSIKIYNLKIQ